MKKEDKDLQLRDLCRRLPYLPKVHADDGLSPDGKGNDYTLLGINANKRIVLLGMDFDGVYATYKEYLDNIKPYLRPLSSMTEKEKEYIKHRWCCDDWTDICDFLNNYKIDAGDAYDFTDWLNANHFDYRGLIPKSLALPSPEGMYNEIEQK